MGRKNFCDPIVIAALNSHFVALNNYRFTQGLVGDNIQMQVNSLSEPGNAKGLNFNVNLNTGEYRVNYQKDNVWATSSVLALKSDLNASLIYRGTFNGDFNDPNIIRGIYTINDPSSYTNGPKKLPGFCCFIHIGIYSTQIIINAKEIYTRKYTGDPIVWSNWATYTGVID